MPSGSATTSFAVTSAMAEWPNRTTRPRCRAAMAATRGSSAFATNVPPGFRPSRISALPSAMASSDAKNCRCAATTRRIAATSGSKARESFERSPGSERPISPTIHSGPRGRLTTDIGNPIWLFWLPGVFSTAKRRDSIAAVKSFVVVVPAEPVIAASRKPIFFFAATPRLRSASTDCGTITAGKPAGSPSGLRSPRSAPAPRAAASCA